MAAAELLEKFVPADQSVGDWVTERLEPLVPEGAYLVGVELAGTHLTLTWSEHSDASLFATSGGKIRQTHTLKVLLDLPMNDVFASQNRGKSCQN